MVAASKGNIPTFFRSTKSAKDRGRCGSFLLWRSRIYGLLMFLLMDLTIAPARSATMDHQAWVLRDGDVVVFYTGQTPEKSLYAAYVTSYALTRFPYQHAKFRVFTSSALTTSASSDRERLRRVLRDFKPAMVVLAPTLEDGSANVGQSGRGLTELRRLIKDVREVSPPTRITLLTPFCIIARQIQLGNGYLEKPLKSGFELLAKDKDVLLVDSNHPIVETLSEIGAASPDLAARVFTNVNSLGSVAQLMMAEAILKAWSAPSLVSTAEIDMSGAGKPVTDNSAVAEWQGPDGFSWIQRDGALPMPLDFADPLVRTVANASGLTKSLNRLMIKVRGLPRLRFALKIDGLTIGEFTQIQLAGGIDLGEYRTPMVEQAQRVQAQVLRQLSAQNPTAMLPDDEMEAARRPARHQFELLPLIRATPLPRKRG